MKPRLILASTSPTRRKIAESIGFKFEVIPSNYKEDMNIKSTPEDLAMTLAFGKAEDVAKNINEGIVIGIDTFVYFEGEIIGKPEDKEDAFRIIKKLSDKTHFIYSGIALIDTRNKNMIKDFEITKVKFRDLNDNEILKYAETGEPMNKSGAYAIQEKGAFLIEKIDGCFYNITGFPINKIISGLKKLNVDISQFIY